MDPLLEHATGLFKGRLNCHAPSDDKLASRRKRRQQFRRLDVICVSGKVDSVSVCAICPTAWIAYRVTSTIELSSP